MRDLVEPKKVDFVYEKENPVVYEVIDHVAWITMDRPDFNNAQNGQMTYALDDAFNRATQDDAVRCIVLAGNGKHFSAGHDIGTPGRDLHRPFENRLMVPGHVNKPGAELLYTREQEQYLGSVPSLARHCQADRGDGAGRVHCRRADARLGMRFDHRERRRVLSGPGQPHGGFRALNILRTPLNCRRGSRRNFCCSASG